MALKYVSIEDGDNGNDGSRETPWQTIPYAQANTSPGDTIFLRAGLYTHAANLDPLRWMDRNWIAYNYEDVIIDCNGAASCFAPGGLDVQYMAESTTYLLAGIKFINFSGSCFSFIDGGTPPGNWNPIEYPVYKIFNCFGRGLSTGTGVIFFDTSVGPLQGNVPGDMIRCTMVDMDHVFDTFMLWRDIHHNIFDGNNYIMTDFTGSSEEFPGYSASGIKDYNAYNGNTLEDHGINTASTPIGFRDRPNLDFALTESSALRNAGENGWNIGAAVDPMLYVDDDTYDLVNGLSNGENDEDYYETGVGPGPEGPVDAGPAIFDGTAWKIGGGKSSRVHFGSLPLPAGAKLTVGSFLALIDETLASGSKEVIGITPTTRDWQISINGGAKQTITRNTLIDLNATTLDIYMTLRADGETEA